MSFLNQAFEDSKVISKTKINFEDWNSHRWLEEARVARSNWSSETEFSFEMNNRLRARPASINLETFLSVAMNGKKNKVFNFPNCELDQWYNLTIVQEEINIDKYKFTITVTELAEEGEDDAEGKLLQK